MAAGVSIIAHSFISGGACRPARILAAETMSPGRDTLGIRIASGPAATAASRSAIPHWVSMALTLTTTSRGPKPRALTASATRSRASALASGATASSRSRIRQSAASPRAFSNARAFAPGM
jgi:hypothetical protein